LILRLLTVVLATSCAALQAQPHSEDSIPLLEYLPNGTSLTHVTIPSYDESKVPTSVLRADEISIIDKEAGLMSLSRPKVEFLSDEQDGYTIELKTAQFHYRESYLEGDENITIENERVAIRGSGVCYDMKEKKVFIKGSAVAVLLTKGSMKKASASAMTAMSILMAAADPPSPPDKKVLSDIAHARAEGSSTVYLKDSSDIVQQERSKVIQKTEEVDQQMSTFLAKVDQSDAIPAPSSATRSEHQFVVPEGALKITCDGGMYYDAEAGHLVCLKNVLVDEPRFELKCDDQLKVFLNTSKEEGKVDQAVAGFGNADVEQLIATGNTRLTYRSNPEKPPIVATGDAAHYDVAKEEILLEGGLPTLRQGASFFEALEPTVWIKLSPKGFLTGPGKKRTIYLTEENE